MRWLTISDLSKYEVSEYGHVRRIKTGRVLKPIYSHGYHRHCLADENCKQVFRTVHRLVLFAFIGPPPFEDAEACHNDGTRTNNHYSNLRWDTRSENNKDKIAHGTSGAKLTEANVIEIRRLKSLGGQVALIARQFDVSWQTVYRIVCGKRWKHVTESSSIQSQGI